jgi:hypothetical protein
MSDFEAERSRMALLTQQILSGWGNIAQSKIPADWRTRKPPGAQAEDLDDETAKKRALKNARRIKLRDERRAESKRQRLEEAAAQMRPRSKTLVRGKKWKSGVELGRAADAAIRRSNEISEDTKTHRNAETAAL